MKMLLINDTHILDVTGGYIQSLNSQIRHTVGVNEISLLTFMFSNKGKVLSKHELMEEVWHKRGIVVESSSLLHSISSCRRGLEDRSGVIIRTERGVGYEFTGSVRKIACISEVENNKQGSEKQPETSEPTQTSTAPLAELASWASVKTVSTFIAAVLGGFVGMTSAEKLLMSNQYVASSYSQCWYQPTDNGERVYYHSPTIYQFDKLSLLLDERGRSVSFDNQSGVVNCED